ncbi:unnamed protein product [Rhizoctonia solani]|uniref:endo-polygalacturonase n=1 Tax=Rhizoctonia solani TaxID=456999 RepID=A0A8H3C6G9_9AGAM|nr:unnamed protein product [Rhizoctonia solani]
MIAAVSILSLVASVLGNPVPSSLETRQSCNINSLSSVAAAEKCSTITIDAFTVPAGQKFVINALDRATINMNGNVVFAADATFKTTGPLFTLTGNNITFNGHGFTIDGQGAKYWDGLGTSPNAKQAKPHPMIKLSCSGTVENVKVLNSPAQVFSMGNNARLIVSNINIDNCKHDEFGLYACKPAAHNTDGFDGTFGSIRGVKAFADSVIVSTNDVTIQGSTIVNQDDCIAINKGSNINFLNNHCTGGHGISVGSIASGSVVSTVRITGNTITNNVQALRIKTDANATRYAVRPVVNEAHADRGSSGSVSDVTYSGNTATGCTSYGVIIDQSYPDTLGPNPGAGVKISGITFTGTNTIAVASSAKGEVEVNCAKGGCTGVWDWAGLKVSGGPSGTILNANIINFKQ